MKESVLFDSEATGRLLDDFLSRLVALNPDRDGDEWGLVGIHRRGDVLAQRLRDRFARESRVVPELGVLDITLYRDDFSPDRRQPTVRPSEIPFAVEGANLLLIDDVFQTGRTIRAALTQLADFGRAKRIVLAVFIDRGLRELPICPDLVGIELDRPPAEMVQLNLREVDGDDRILGIAR